MKAINYIGTRNKNITATASEAILKGICDDGGLFIPNEIPAMEKSLDELSKLTYKQLAFEVLSLYLTDFTDEELKYCIDGAYDEKFDTKVIAPTVKVGDISILELFHGRTQAFKDMALSILPYLMKIAARKNGLKKEIVILAATSGDTGKAALEGFSNVEGTRIIVFFPEDGVSPVQKLQMTTQEGDNTCVVSISGNFDDAQSAVKGIFTDKEMIKQLDERGFVFSSANSINIGRLVPQVVYYFYNYLQMAISGEIKLGEEINVSVPTGNFGNILAGYLAKNMGLPIKTLICASNENKVLYDFFTTGEYNKNREFFVTTSPSMDILISSNLERLLCIVSTQEKTKELMDSLIMDGKYSMEIRDGIASEYADEKETSAAIKKVYDSTGYIMDTHTAVAYSAYEKYKAKTKDNTKVSIVSTASPYKFTKDVLVSIDRKYESGDAFELMYELEKLSGVDIPSPIKDIDKREVLHKNVCDKDKIKDFVKDHLLV